MCGHGPENVPFAQGDFIMFNKLHVSTTVLYLLAKVSKRSAATTHLYQDASQGSRLTTLRGSNEEITIRCL